MASSAAPDAPAAMAVDREAEGAGALLGPEEDINDDVLSNLLSASWLLNSNSGRPPRSWTRGMGATLGPPWGGRFSNGAFTRSTAVV